MNSLAYIPASDGAANASLMTVTNVRSGGATTIQVNTVANAPTKFYASYGTPHTFTDPVTGETITVISEATAVDFAGHIDGSNVEIDEIAPGYTDNGNEVGDIIVIRPVTEWANNLHNVIKNRAINPVGSIIDFAGVTAPEGWLLCYGQTLNATTNTEYQELYDVIGNTYGGTNNTDFVVPDLRGRVIAGQDNMGGVSADRLTNFSNSVNSQSVDGDVLGATGGTEKHNHRHTFAIGKDSGAGRFLDPVTGGVDYPDDSDVYGGGVVSMGRASSGGAISTAGVERYTQRGTSESTVQPTIILNKIIKY